jgi:hypothetical protein
MSAPSPSSQFQRPAAIARPIPPEQLLVNTRRLLFLASGLAALSLGLLVRECLAQDDAASPFQNVQVLTQVKSKKEMRGIMKAQAKALGVKCTYCHVQGKFSLDDKKKKVQAREMLKMVAEINTNWFAEEEHGVTCWTCHRGVEEPESTRPAEADGSGEGFEAADPPK